jgi:hypothetical protein
MPLAPNYPDILGYITSGERFNVGVVQAALALRPDVIPAGNSFELILVLQNNSDVNVNVAITLYLPECDTDKKTERFFTHKDRLNIALQPAEVGYVSAPLLSLPDTAISDTYRIGVNLEATPLSKPYRIRQTDRPREINLDYYFYVSEDSINQLMLLKWLSFSTAKKSLLTNVIEVPFKITAQEIGKFSKLKPRWISLWSLGSHSDARPLFERYRESFVQIILPQLTRHNLYKALFKSTDHRFKAAGCQLEPVETHFIVEALLSLLEMASATSDQDHIDYPGNESYRVKQLFQQNWPLDGQPVPLPYWCRGLLEMMGLDESVSQHPERALAGPLYSLLIRDAIDHSFQVLKPITSEMLVEADDIRVYSELFVEMIERKRSGLTFTEVYLPIALAGVVTSRVGTVTGETLHNLLVQLYDLSEKRWSPSNEDEQVVAGIVYAVLEWALRQYTQWF